MTCYRVTVTITDVQTVTVEVEADNPAAAGYLAHSQLMDLDFEDLPRWLDINAEDADGPTEFTVAVLRAEPVTQDEE